jgi:HAD superfamily hydrolase (TIGR01509 family)
LGRGRPRASRNSSRRRSRSRADAAKPPGSPPIIDTLFLDAGGVLVFPNWTRVSDALARHGVAADAAALAAAEPHVKRQIDVAQTVSATSDHGRAWMYFDLILERVGVLPDERTAAALRELYAYHQRYNLWEYVPDEVDRRLRELRALGLRLTVVSNANGQLTTLFDRLGLSQHFDCLIDSFVEGVEKPDPRLFEIALSRCGARPDSTLHVGDLYHVDITGARAAGLAAVLVDEADLHGEADCPRIASIAELSALLALA